MVRRLYNNSGSYQDTKADYGVCDSMSVANRFAWPNKSV